MRTSLAAVIEQVKVQEVILNDAIEDQEYKRPLSGQESLRHRHQAR